MRRLSALLAVSAVLYLAACSPGSETIPTVAQLPTITPTYTATPLPTAIPPTSTATPITTADATLTALAPMISWWEATEPIFLDFVDVMAQSENTSPNGMTPLIREMEGLLAEFRRLTPPPTVRALSDSIDAAMAETIALHQAYSAGQDTATFITLSEQVVELWGEVYTELATLGAQMGFPVEPSSGPDAYSCPAACSQYTSCAQARYCLRHGHPSLDSDHDGIPCESLCGG